MDVKDLEWRLVKEELDRHKNLLPPNDLFAGPMEMMANPLDYMKSHPEAKTAGGTKHDDGKPDLSLVPYIAVSTEALALGFGEKKYGRYNYTSGFEVSRLTAAALRHIYQYNSGETFDHESGLHHIGHARACLAILLHCEQLGTLRDNRYKR